MRKFFNILKKEIKELLTLRMIMPFIISILIIMFVGRAMRGEMERTSTRFSVGVLDNDQTQISKKIIDALSNAGYYVELLKSMAIDSMIQSGLNKNLKLIIVIPESLELHLKDKKGAGIEFYSIIRSLGMTESMQRAAIRNLLSVINNEISNDYIKEFSNDLDPGAIKYPIKAKEYVYLKGKINPGSAQMVIAFVTMQTIFVPIILLMLIIFTSTMIASSIAQEKENKTLETLLTVPVSRLSIVSGKMLAAAILAVVFAGIFMFGFGDYMSSFQTQPGMSQAKEAMQQISKEDISLMLELALDFKSNLLLGISIFLSVISALSMATLLALFAREVRDAQATIMPLMVMVLLPYFFSMFFDPQTMSMGLKVLLYIIPFSHTFFAFKYLLMGQILPVIGGIVYLAIFAFALLVIASRIFSSDKIFTLKFRLRRK